MKAAEGKVARVEVIRGAPCGATWDAARRVKGLPVEDAIFRIGLETQYFCSADPSGWDPIHGKSPVHFAGEVHKAALKKAMTFISQHSKKHFENKAPLKSRILDPQSAIHNTPYVLCLPKEAAPLQTNHRGHKVIQI